MKKLICFSLWGDNKKYTIGAIRNAEIAKNIFKGWICRFYTGQSVPQYIIDKLISIDNVEVVQMDVPGNWEGMFWRFLPAGEPDVEVMISRDCDSRLGTREKSAIDEWLTSSKKFHIMRDHPHHGTQILGGMWGARGGLLNDIKGWIDEYKKGDYWQVDQNFLKEIVYPKVVNDSMVHDEFFKYESHRRRFPKNRVNFEFVGEVFTEKDTRENHYIHIMQYQLSLLNKK